MTMNGYIWQARDPWASFTLHANFTTSQNAFRFRADDGSETAATWLAAENTNITNFDIVADSHLRVRIAIQETGGGAANNVDLTLQYQRNGGTWTNVSGSTSVVTYVASSFVSNGTATTRQLTTPTGTFIPGEFISEDDSAARTNFTASAHTELEFSVDLISADLTNGDTINFRVLANGGVLTTYAQTPSLTVLVPQQGSGSATDTIEVSDSATGEAWEPESYSDSVSETINVSDSATAAVARSNATTETISVADSASGVKFEPAEEYSAITSETITVSDTASGEKAISHSTSEIVQIITSATGVAASAAEFVADVLIVGGGGGGGPLASSGGGRSGGGGGAGGLRWIESLSLDIGEDLPVTVTVGNGGGSNQSGQNSSFYGYTAIGGGHGGGLSTPAVGGSGGGGRGDSYLGPQNGASGTAGQGHAGGNGNNQGTFNGWAHSGGGGGAGGVGGNSVGTTSGSGGFGGPGMDFSSIFGTGVGEGGWFAGGGGGGSTVAAGSAGLGNGAANTGGGGRGANANGTPTAGRSGVVIVRIDKATIDEPLVGGTLTEDDDYYYHTFTASGTLHVQQNLTGSVSETVQVSTSVLTGKDGLSYSNVIKDAGPVAYWRLDETSGTSAVDEMGNHNGTYINSPTLGQPPAIQDGTSVDFVRASANRIQVPHHANLQLTTVMTLEAWVKRNAHSQGYTFGEGIINSGIGGYNLRFTNNGSVQLERHGSGNIVISSIQLNDTDWHHIVITRNGSYTTAKIYVDGVDVSDTRNDRTPTAPTADIAIASTNDSSTDWNPAHALDGHVDEVAIYDYALTASEIQYHYDVGVGNASTQATVEVSAQVAGIKSLEAETNEVITVTSTASGALEIIYPRRSLWPVEVTSKTVRWVPEPSGTTNLHDRINSTDLSRYFFLDYIDSGNETITSRLDGYIGPIETSNPFYLEWHIIDVDSFPANPQYSYHLYQGTTQLWGASTSVYGERQVQIPTSVVNQITNWSDVRVRFQRISSSGNINRIRLYWARMDMPDASVSFGSAASVTVQVTSSASGVATLTSSVTEVVNVSASASGVKSVAVTVTEQIEITSVVRIEIPFETPSYIHASRITSTTIRIFWEDVGASFYELQRQTHIDGIWGDLQTFEVHDTIYDDSAAPNTDIFRYRVRGALDLE